MKRRIFAGVILALILTIITVAFATSFTYTYDKTTPAGTDAPSVIDDRIREVKLTIQEREDVDHYWPYASVADVAGGNEVASAYTGEHRKITFYSTISAPTQVSGKAHLYMNSDELYYQDDTNTTLKITDAGSLNITSSDLVGTLANNTYFTAVDAAGTGTVDLIKADANDVAVVPDNSQTATNAAPTSTTGIANKKYVDDQITAKTALSAYTTEDSESNAMLKSHAYKAATDGYVYAEVQLTTAGWTISGHVGTTNDPVGAGERVGYHRANGTDAWRSVFFAVAKDEYFEIIVSGGTPTIKWKSKGTLSKPIDQD